MARGQVHEILALGWQRITSTVCEVEFREFGFTEQVQRILTSQVRNRLEDLRLAGDFQVVIEWFMARQLCKLGDQVKLGIVERDEVLLEILAFLWELN